MKASIAEILEHPILSGFKCIAEYSDQQISTYKGNPLIESLPPIYESAQVTMLLADFPDHDDSQRNWEAETRNHCVEQLKHFMQPLPYHSRLEGCFSRIIRDGYVVRNPMSSIFAQQFSVGFSKILEAGLNGKGKNITGNRPSASGFAIIGLSGMGKTTAVERSLLLYPQVIQHTKYNNKPFILKQLVWLKLDCPASGSLKVLCQNFFRQVDLILGTNYYKQHVNSKSTKENLLVPMAQIASLHGLGVLVIDEMQRLKKIKNSGESEMLDYLTELINTIGIPIVLVGTYQSMFLFESAFANARRASDQGDHILSNMENGLEWEFFLESLWDLQWTQKKCPLSNELKAVMYEESLGIIDVAIKLYKNAQWEAISNGTEEITVALIKDVAKRCLKLIRQPMLGLKTGNLDAIRAYEDMKPDWLTLNDYIKSAEEKVLIQGRVATEHKRAIRKHEKEEIMVDLISTAISLGLSPEEAEEASLKVVRASGGTAELTIMRQRVANIALNRITNAFVEYEQIDSDNEKLKSKKKSKLLISKDDPWCTIFQTFEKRGCVSDALKQVGLLKLPAEELIKY